MSDSFAPDSPRLENGVLTIPAKGRCPTKEYRVEALNPDPDVGFPAIRLIALDGSASVYDLLKTSYGWVCDCPDYKARREGTGEACKHLDAAHRVGLLTHGG